MASNPVVDLEAIRCPTLVSYGEGDYAEATAHDFYERLNVAKGVRDVPEADGSGGRCEGMGVTRYYASTFAFVCEHV